MTNLWICANCGYGSQVRFLDDKCPHCRMTDWHCAQCGYTLTASTAPVSCSQCGRRKSYVNITGYIPDWHPTEAVGRA